MLSRCNSKDEQDIYVIVFGTGHLQTELHYCYTFDIGLGLVA